MILSIDNLAVKCQLWFNFNGTIVFNFFIGNLISQICIQQKPYCTTTILFLLTLKRSEYRFADHLRCHMFIDFIAILENQFQWFLFYYLLTLKTWKWKYDILLFYYCFFCYKRLRSLLVLRERQVLFDFWKV